ncbi:MAG: DUF3047 domain-containing protein [Fodinibius sp.]|nr:DUF3047 domain-containing protein [Fodinibius sp.]
MKPYTLPLILLIFISGIGLFDAKGQPTVRLPVTSYEEQSDPQNDSTWVLMGVNSDNLTDYSLQKSTDQHVIKAVSNNAAGGLIYKTRIDPKEYPIIEWRWKVDGIIQDGNLRKKSGDDYPARIYITFDYDKSNLGLGDRIKYEAIKTFTSYKIQLRAIILHLG